ncbi:TBC1 domain family member 15 isoform X2 [Agrilus planipennis]|uniref:TBC1 domain family member 15 n=1 Tax=Agrilus planipennis TaxID=224129 RepID=A0A1W4X1R8_AGRPL|nr:TBC1 domain family member 15 isoform X2 [Agrilus planipennis]
METNCNKMEDSDEFMELYIQDGVLLNSAPATYMNCINTTGTLLITEYLNSNKTRYIEWKPNDVTIDSDVQDQEWAVVNTVKGRNRTFSGSLPPESSNRSKYIKINFKDIKSFRVARSSHKLTFYDGKSDPICTFTFLHCNCDSFVGCLKSFMRTALAKRDKHLFIVLDDYLDTPETNRLDKSFAELDLFQEQPSDLMWRFVKNFQNKPYETTMEAFSKLTDIVYRGPEHRYMDDEVNELLNRSLEGVDYSLSTQYEYVPKLPERKEPPRGTPLTIEQWKTLQDNEGRIEDVEPIKAIIFRGGIDPALRKEVWKYLLDYYPWNSTHEERSKIIEKKKAEYYTMKRQWSTMSQIQEDNFSDFRERKSLIEKDVRRTDRTLDYFSGDNNPNLEVLYDILMTYAMYNFDLGYVQGMSDLLSPILNLEDNEVDAFWCFVGFMNKVSLNFDIDQAGMKEQLQHLHTLLEFLQPELANYLDHHDSGNMFFCFRWVLVWFKRELSQEDTTRLWEVLWTGVPCHNFHLLVCIAILETEKDALVGNNYGFTEILRHVNDLSGNLNVDAMICRAEGMYYQIREAEHLTNNIRSILGLPLVNGTTDTNDSKEASPLTSTDVSNDLQSCSLEAIGDEEVQCDRAINLSYL